METLRNTKVVRLAVFKTLLAIHRRDVQEVTAKGVRQYARKSYVQNQANGPEKDLIPLM